MSGRTEGGERRAPPFISVQNRWRFTFARLCRQRRHLPPQDPQEGGGTGAMAYDLPLRYGLSLESSATISAWRFTPIFSKAYFR